jgi:glycosyltransferase involved in cell wall biosynthesis
VAQGMDVFLDLAERLRERKDIGFLFVGRGSELPRLRARATEARLQNVVFHDEIDPDEVPGLLGQCQVGLLALDPRHKTHNIPGKFLTYVQAGLPVLARINANNDLVKVIEDEGVGRVDQQATVDSLHGLAELMASDPAARARMSEKGKALAEKLFSPAVAVRQIVAALARPTTEGRG